MSWMWTDGLGRFGHGHVSLNPSWSVGGGPWQLQWVAYYDGEPSRYGSRPELGYIETGERSDLLRKLDRLASSEQKAAAAMLIIWTWQRAHGALRS